MNNEPVAYVDKIWIDRPDLAMDLGIGQMFSRCQLSDHQIPLYTHPVKEQDESFDRTASHMAGEYVSYKAELTDEEILEVWKENEKVYPMDRSRLLDRTRACIRKAQEK